MTFALGHIVGAWILGKLYEVVSSKKINQSAWFFVIFGGLLPDADFLLDWTLGTELHRTFTHSFLFLIAAPLITYIVFRYIRKNEAKQFAHALAIGIIAHLILDMTTSSYGVPLFWPSLLHVSIFGIHYVDPALPSFLHRPADYLRHSLKLTIVDMAIGTAWVFYLWFKKKIQF